MDDFHLAAMPEVVLVGPGGLLQWGFQGTLQGCPVWRVTFLIPAEFIRHEDNQIQARGVRFQGRVVADGAEEFHEAGVKEGIFF